MLYIQLVEAQYGIPASVPSQTASQLGVSGFIQQFAQLADLSVCPIFSQAIPSLLIHMTFSFQSFLRAFRPDLSPTTAFGLQTLDGGSNPQSAAQAGIEAVGVFQI